jgi:predicted RNA methylase
MKITPDVLAVLQGCETEADLLRLPGQLDRALYVRTNQVLEAAGGKWNRKAKAHVFAGDASDALDQLVSTGEYRDTKRELNQFYTPPALARRLVELARVAPGDEVLEPSAGRGFIASAVQEAGGFVSCIEIDPANHAALLAAGFSRVRQCDFLTVPAARVYDAVVMNPPFAARQDIRHVTHAAKFLRPGGRLAAIMSASIKYRSDRLARDFRELVAAHGGRVDDLDEGSFKESGTMVRTVVVTMRKAA